MHIQNFIKQCTDRERTKKTSPWCQKQYCCRSHRQ